MFEYLYFDTTGITKRNYEISLTTSLNKIYYRFTYEGDGMYVREGERYYGDEWSRALEDLRIGFWEEEYQYGKPILGKGYTFEIMFKEVGQRARLIRGVNAVPVLWDSFIALLDQLDPDSLVRELTNVPECSDTD